MPAQIKKPSEIVDALLAEAAGGDMRFDLSCRVEVWITEDDLESDPRYRKIVASGKDKTTIVTELRALAAELASNKLSSVGDQVGGTLEITCDSVGADAVNIDRIDWSKLSVSSEERQAAEEREAEEENRRWDLRHGGERQ